MRNGIAIVVSENVASITSGKKQRGSNADVANASTMRTSDVNVSGVSSTPASDVGGDSTATRRTRRNAPSMPSLMELPPPMEVPPPTDILPPVTDDELPLLVSSPTDDMVIASSSNNAMVSFDVSVFIFVITYNKINCLSNEH